MSAKDEDPQKNVQQQIEDQPDPQNIKDYEILKEDNTNFDLCFKIIVIGNSGNSNY